MGEAEHSHLCGTCTHRAPSPSFLSFPSLSLSLSLSSLSLSSLLLYAAPASSPRAARCFGIPAARRHGTHVRRARRAVREEGLEHVGRRQPLAEDGVQEDARGAGRQRRQTRGRLLRPLLRLPALHADVRAARLQDAQGVLFCWLFLLPCWRSLARLVSDSACAVSAAELGQGGLRRHCGQGGRQARGAQEGAEGGVRLPHTQQRPLCFHALLLCPFPLPPCAASLCHKRRSSPPAWPCHAACPACSLSAPSLRCVARGQARRPRQHH